MSCAARGDELFVCDGSERLQVFRVPAGTFVRTLVVCRSPKALCVADAVDGSGVVELFVSCDYYRVYVYDAHTGAQRRVIGTPLSNSNGDGDGQLLRPTGVAVDREHVYVANHSSHRIELFA